MNKFSLFTIFLLTGCATAINQKNAEFYHQAGLQAEWAGDYVLAERNFSRALINAQSGNSPKAGISMAKYNLGRIKGYLCKNDESEQLLLDSLTLEEEVTGSESAVTSKRLFELARFYYDNGVYNESAMYYERAIPVVIKLGVKEKDPIALASAMDEYAIALTKTGNSEEAANIKDEANQLRASNPNADAKFVPVRYNTSCN